MLKKLIMIAVTAIGIARGGEVHQSMNGLMRQLVREGRTVEQATPYVVGAYMKATIERCEAPVAGVPMVVLKLKSDLELMRVRKTQVEVSEALPGIIYGFIREVQLPHLFFLVDLVAKEMLKYLSFYCLGIDELRVAIALRELREQIRTRTTIPVQAVVDGNTKQRLVTLDQQTEFLKKLYSGTRDWGDDDVRTAVGIYEDRQATMLQIMRKERTGRKIHIIEPEAPAIVYMLEGIAPGATPTLLCYKQLSEKKGKGEYVMGRIELEWRADEQNKLIPQAKYVGKEQLAWLEGVLLHNKQDGSHAGDMAMWMLRNPDICKLMMECPEENLKRLSPEDKNAIMALRELIYSQLKIENARNEEYDKKIKERNEKAQALLAAYRGLRWSIIWSINLKKCCGTNTDPTGEALLAVTLPWLCEVLGEALGVDIISWYSRAWLELRLRRREEWMKKRQGMTGGEAKVVLSSRVCKILQTNVSATLCKRSNQYEGLARLLGIDERRIVKSVDEVYDLGPLTADRIAGIGDPMRVRKLTFEMIIGCVDGDIRYTQDNVAGEAEIEELALQLDISAAAQ
jgi:hypothetical protein